MSQAAIKEEFKKLDICKWRTVEEAKKRIPCPDCGSFDLETIFKTAPAYVKGTRLAKCPQRSSCGSSCPHAG